MANLSGMLQGIAGDIGNPTRLSEGQRGLFNTLGNSLAPMPQVNQEDPNSLRAAAAEAMRRGDAQMAQTYATMAQQVERTQLVQREEQRATNRAAGSLLDEGNADIQASLAQKKDMQARQSAGAAYERFLSPDLLMAVKRGDMSVADAMKQQQRMNEQSNKATQAVKPSVLRPGDIMVGPDGQPLAKNEKAPEEVKLSSYMQRRLGGAIDASRESDVKASEYNGLADMLEANADKFSAGVVSDALEFAKGATGRRDLESSLRTNYRRLRSSDAVRNLPPGPASDKDVALALEGFPPPDAQPEELASFARGMAKLENASKLYEDTRADYISRNRDEAGFGEHWRALQRAEQHRTAPPQAVEMLRADPSLLPAFQDKYGYNPLEEK